MSLLLAILGGIAAVRMSTDIFPDINIPVVSAIWAYPGISADEMEKRICTVVERGMTTTVNDIEHIESQSINGISVIKVFFHPNAKVEAGVAQIASISNTVLRVMPPGITPPFIVRYNASSVPIIQLALGGKNFSEQQLFDFGQNFVRTQLSTIQGASVLLPAGGKSRQIMVDLDPQALYAKGLSPADVSAAINTQNLILPAGSAKMGDREYAVRLNSSPPIADAINSMPIKQSNGATVYVRDVAQVHDGAAVQGNLVRLNGQRSSFLSILKNGGASTLDIVKRVRETIPKIAVTLPQDFEMKLLFDQSLFVRASINGVIKEAVIAAFLTAMMILLFLGSWRSTLIVCISIPLSILTSLFIMFLLGETINVMTLGGLSLAVGILVDDATVEIENIHRNLGLGKSLIRGILDGAQQIAVPAFVSTLAICIVFVPVVFLSGAAKYLFTPLSLAVVFAMLTSYFLSRTLVPTMVQYLLEPELDVYRETAEGQHAGGHGLIWAVHHACNRQFEKFREGYGAALTWTLENRKTVFTLFMLLACVSGVLVSQLGQDFFPQVDAGQFRLHVRGPAGMRIENTERLFSQVEDRIRDIVPLRERGNLLDNIGVPFFPASLAYSDSATIGSSDGEILFALTEERSRPTGEYVRQLRQTLPREFPDSTFFFQSADIVSQILNFGLPAPIDIQVVGRNLIANYAIAREIEQRVAGIPGAVDVHIHQVMNAPQIDLNVDRTRSDQFGVTQRDVANSMLISLSSSSLVAPNFWLSPQNGVSYIVAVQTPQHLIDSVEKLQSTPITSPGGSGAQLLRNLATVGRSTTMANISHFNVQPVIDIYANVQDRDLGGVANDIDRIIGGVNKKLPRGTSVIMRGQVETMRSSFIGLGAGMVLAVLLVYFLMVVNFQSWLDPFIILMALPGAFSGIVWMLFVTQTTLNVPSLMGAIMSIGVATANSILLVTFANEQLEEGKDSAAAAFAAGFTRLRPVVMTALAMIIGMLPMSLGLGEGGEQNAPLGRAVIGGLLVATFTTLFFVPVVYSYLRARQPQPPLKEDWEMLL
jgi:multidrug efflux pump subunit AcrB